VGGGGPGESFWQLFETMFPADATGVTKTVVLAFRSGPVRRKWGGKREMANAAGGKRVRLMGWSGREIQRVNQERSAEKRGVRMESGGGGVNGKK